MNPHIPPRERRGRMTPCSRLLRAGPSSTHRAGSLGQSQGLRHTQESGSRGGQSLCTNPPGSQRLEKCGTVGCLSTAFQNPHCWQFRQKSTRTKGKEEAPGAGERQASHGTGKKLGVSNNLRKTRRHCSSGGHSAVGSLLPPAQPPAWLPPVRAGPQPGEGSGGGVLTRETWSCTRGCSGTR